MCVAWHESHTRGVFLGGVKQTLLLMTYIAPIAMKPLVPATDLLRSSFWRAARYEKTLRGHRNFLRVWSWSPF